MKNTEKKKKGLSRLLPTKRGIIQLYSALLFNCYLKGYVTGEIFKGLSKNVCTPGLNCYSCPGAVTSCPIGSLQNAFSSANKSTAYYMLGIIMLYGVIFGRWICGWLCPFGLFQDLLYKIKTPKLKKNKITRALSYFKYVVLLFFVVILPVIYLFRDFPLPAFCKYICPAGTVGGAIGLLINPENSEIFGMLGPLFTWKFALAVSFIVAAVFIYRVFCRFVCPLGAIYGLFNKIAIFGIKLEKKRCIDCGRCISKCKMDIRHVGDRECINCGECIPVCPTQAIRWKVGQIILPDSEIENAREKITVTEPQAPTVIINEKALVSEKRKRRVKVIGALVAIALFAILIGGIVYMNFIYEPPSAEITPPDDGNGDEEEGPSQGNKVGNLCPSFNLELVSGDGTVSVKGLRGKAVVINFWGIWCGPCKSELPHFDRLAEEYSDDVVFLTVHTHTDRAGAPGYINENYPDSKMIFAYDVPLNPSNPDLGDMYYSLLGGTGFYPRTLVLDEDGIISFTVDGSISYASLKAEIDKALAK